MRIAEMKESPLTKAEKEELVLEFFNTRRKMRDRDFEGDDPTMYAWEDMAEAGIITSKGEINKRYMMAISLEEKARIEEYMYDEGPGAVLKSKVYPFQSIKDPVLKDLFLDAQEAYKKFIEYIDYTDPAEIL